MKFSAGQTAVPEQVALTLSNVTFAYDKPAQNALEDITLSVDAGQRIAILAVRDVENRHFCNFSRARGTHSRARFGLTTFRCLVLAKRPCVKRSASCPSGCICSALRCAIIFFWRHQTPPTIRCGQCWSRLGCTSCLKTMANSWLGEGVDSFPAANCVVWPLRVRCCTMRR